MILISNFLHEFVDTFGCLLTKSNISLRPLGLERGGPKRGFLLFAISFFCVTSFHCFLVSTGAYLTKLLKDIKSSNVSKSLYVLCKQKFLKVIKRHQKSLKATKNVIIEVLLKNCCAIYDRDKENWTKSTRILLFVK